MTDTSRCIVACTDESGRYAATVAAAADRAKSSGAAVILYDVAAPSTFSDPRPNIWAGEGERDVYDHPLDPIELEKLGRHDFALQVQGLRDGGVQAFGWLPDSAGGAALAEYASRQQAELVLVPADIDEPDYVSAVQGSTGTLNVELIGSD